MNYQNELEEIIKKKCLPFQENASVKLFLHSCCAPCSSYVIEYLSEYFAITIFYYNPNISEQEEYEKRVAEQIRLIKEMKTKYPVLFYEGTYEPQQFFRIAKGLEDSREGEERCFGCYQLRLEETAKEAKNRGFDFFATTLTISPLKNATKINEIGKKIAKQYGVAFLPSDFKKKNGYQRSIVLSKEFNLYRQDYCGCIYSKTQKESDHYLKDTREFQDEKNT
jgi:epoxyqueuosine reductase